MAKFPFNLSKHTAFVARKENQKQERCQNNEAADNQEHISSRNFYSKEVKVDCKVFGQKFVYNIAVWWQL